MKRKTSSTGCLTSIIALFLIFGWLSSCSSDSDNSTSTVSDSSDTPNYYSSVLDSDTETEDADSLNDGSSKNDTAHTDTGAETPAYGESVIEPGAVESNNAPSEIGASSENQQQTDYQSQETSYTDTVSTEEPKTEDTSAIVYITETGSKYHYGGCRHLSNSKIEISLSDAIAQGYGPCGTCH